jgi:hypothetical protein
MFVREQDLPELIVRERRLLDILELHKYAHSSDSMILSNALRSKRHALKNLLTFGWEDQKRCSRMWKASK